MINSTKLSYKEKIVNYKKERKSWQKLEICTNLSIPANCSSINKNYQKLKSKNKKSGKEKKG